MAWGKLDDRLYDHPKLEDLPTDPEACEAILASLDPEQLVRLAALGLWARSISWSNRFLTDGDVPRGKLAKLDGSPELADAMVGAGFLDGTSHGYAIHDFLDFNDSREAILERRAKEAERKAEWRRSRDSRSSPGGTNHGTEGHVPGGTDSDVPGGTNGNGVNGAGQGVPAGTDPLVPAGQTTGQTPLSQRDSRTRGTRAREGDAHAESRPDPTRPDQESLRRESARTTERADVQALRDRGWKRVTKAQRSVLDEVLDRHDVTGPEFAAEVIRNTPPDQDPLAAVMDADRLWQSHQRRRADAEEKSWTETKAEEREQAEEFVIP